MARTDLRRQFIEQCPGPNQVGGVESLGEPAVDLGQALAGFLLPSLLLPQATQDGPRGLPLAMRQTTAQWVLTLYNTRNEDSTFAFRSRSIAILRAKSATERMPVGLEEVLEMVGILFGVVGLLTFVVLPASAARAEQALWSKCRGKESLRETQLRISLGKSRIR
jgi:hypothetical protein